ncbi:MAG: HIT domain-containing protein [Bdellovibrionaceae bacterium]|nr:HIT domain-containing protein [Pseudobdellovibrionaceae bacterium]
MKRRVLYRPERYQYIKKIDQPKTCVFCDAASMGVGKASLCVYRSEYSMILLNKFPYNNGHILILPLNHIGNLLELSPVQYEDLMATVRKAMMAIENIYHPAAMNLGMNHGAAAGAGIPDHLHFHIVPRWSGDLNFFPLIAETKVVIETLEQTFDNFMRYFSK